MIDNELKYLGNNTKGKFFLKWFRRSHKFTKSRTLRFIGFPVRLFYKVIFNYLLGIDIPDTTRIGIGFNVFHGQGLVISSDTTIGSYVTVRQNTTIGNARPGGGSPQIGNNVEIGANVVIIGPIVVGDGSIIAAGAVVIRSVPPGVLIAGNPATIKKNVDQYKREGGI